MNNTFFGGVDGGLVELTTSRYKINSQILKYSRESPSFKLLPAQLQDKVIELANDSSDHYENILTPIFSTFFFINKELENIVGFTNSLIKEIDDPADQTLFIDDVLLDRVKSNKSIDILKKEILFMSENKKRLENKLNEATNSFNHNEKKLQDKLAAQKMSFETKKLHHENKIQLLKTETKSLKEQLHENAAKITILTENLTRSGYDVVSVNKLNEDLKAQIIVFKQEQHAGQVLLHTLEAQINQLKTNISNDKQECVEKNLVLQAEITRKNANITKLSEKLANATNEKVSITKEVSEKLANSINENAALKEQGNQYLNSINQTKNNLSTELNATKNELEETKNSLKNKLVQFETLNRENIDLLNEKNRLQDLLTNQFNDLNQVNSNLVNEKLNKTIEVENLKKKMKLDNDSAAEKAELDKKRIRNEMDSLKKQMTKQNEHINTLNDKILSLNELIKIKNLRIDNLEKAYADYGPTKIAEAEDARKKLQIDLESKATEVENASKKFKVDLESKTKQVENEKKKIEEEKKIAQDEILSLRKQIATLNEHLITSRSEIVLKDRRNKNLDDTITKLSETIKKLENGDPELFRKNILYNNLVFEMDELKKKYQRLQQDYRSLGLRRQNAAAKNVLQTQKSVDDERRRKELVERMDDTTSEVPATQMDTFPAQKIVANPTANFRKSKVHVTEKDSNAVLTDEDEESAKTPATSPNINRKRKDNKNYKS